MSDDQLEEEGRDILKEFMKRQGPMLEELTSRQKEIFEIISGHLVREGISPSLREIGRHAGISSLNGVNDHLKALMRKGWIRHSGKGRARGYTLSAAALEKVPGASRSLNHVILRKLSDFVRDFPDNVVADMRSCATPQEGALLVVNIVDDILSGDY